MFEGEGGPEQQVKPGQRIPIVGEVHVEGGAHVDGQDRTHVPFAAHHVRCARCEEERVIWGRILRTLRFLKFNFIPFLFFLYLFQVLFLHSFFRLNFITFFLYTFFKINLS